MSGYGTPASACGCAGSKSGRPSEETLSGSGSDRGKDCVRGESVCGPLEGGGLGTVVVGVVAVVGVDGNARKSWVLCQQYLSAQLSGVVIRSDKRVLLLLLLLFYDYYYCYCYCYCYYRYFMIIVIVIMIILFIIPQEDLVSKPVRTRNSNSLRTEHQVH